MDSVQAARLLESFGGPQICSLCQSLCQCLDNHVLQVHKNAKLIQCPYCLNFIHPMAIKFHIDLHFTTKELTYNCSICKNDFASMRAYLLHAHGAFLCASFVFHKCYHCHQPFDLPQDLFKHLEMVKLELYSCSIPGCHMKSLKREQVMLHCKRKHGDMEQPALVGFHRDFMCSWPYFLRPLAMFRDRNAIMSGKDHKDSSLICPTCSFNTKTLKNFLDHCRRCHYPLSKVQIFGCSHCSAISQSLKTIQTHELENHNLNIMNLRVYICEIDLLEKLMKVAKFLSAEVGDSGTGAAQRNIFFVKRADFRRAFRELSSTPEGQSLRNFSVKQAWKAVLPIHELEFKTSGEVVSCPVCPDTFLSGLSEIKLHYLTQHLQLPMELASLASRFTTSQLVRKSRPNVKKRFIKCKNMKSEENMKQKGGPKVKRGSKASKRGALRMKLVLALNHFFSLLRVVKTKRRSMQVTNSSEKQFRSLISAWHRVVVARCRAIGVRDLKILQVIPRSKCDVFRIRRLVRRIASKLVFRPVGRSYLHLRGAADFTHAVFRIARGPMFLLPLLRCFDAFLTLNNFKRNQSKKSDRSRNAKSKGLFDKITKLNYTSLNEKESGKISSERIASPSINGRGESDVVCLNTLLVNSFRAQVFRKSTGPETPWGTRRRQNQQPHLVLVQLSSTPRLITSARRLNLAHMAQGLPNHVILDGEAYSLASSPHFLSTSAASLIVKSRHLSLKRDSSPTQTRSDLGKRSCHLTTNPPQI